MCYSSSKAPASSVMTCSINMVQELKSLGTFMPPVHKEDILLYNVSCDCNLIAQNNIKSRTPKKAGKIIKNAI